VQRWSLATLERELAVPLPGAGEVGQVLMGSASRGPLVVGGVLLDIQTLRPLELKAPGNQQSGFFGARAGARVSADGRVLSGPEFVMTVLPGPAVRTYHVPNLLGHITPSPDGRVIHTTCGRYTVEDKPPAAHGNRPALYSDGACYCLPAVEGCDLFLHLA